jgi:predicted RNA methylase
MCNYPSEECVRFSATEAVTNSPFSLPGMCRGYDVQLLRKLFETEHRVSRMRAAGVDVPAIAEYERKAPGFRGKGPG